MLIYYKQNTQSWICIRLLLDAGLPTVLFDESFSPLTFKFMAILEDLLWCDFPTDNSTVAHIIHEICELKHIAVVTKWETDFGLLFFRHLTIT